MPFNGSGTYSLFVPGNPVVTNTTISSTWWNNTGSDLATALSNVICRDGQTTVTANIPFSAFKLTGIGAATARTDAASLATIQDGTGVYVGTVGGTADVITLTPSPAITAYAAGQTFRFIASGANTTAVTVAVSGLAAKAITKNGTTALIAGDIPSGAMVEITYDGTRFILGNTGAATGIPVSIIDAAGDLIVGTAADTAGRLAIGTALQQLRVNAGATALEWATGSGGTTTVPRLLENAGLSVAMAANAVTIALKGADGNDPSSSNAVGVSFRSATLTSGASSKVSVTAATSTVISSGSTGGTVSATASRIWIGAILTGGAVEIAWFNARSGVNVAPINEGGVISTTAEGGAGGADTAQTWYSTTARASVPVTILGYFDSTQATAGTWAAAADVVVVNPEYRPGRVIQFKRAESSAAATGSTAIPDDNSVPTAAEGNGIAALDIAMTATAAANLVRRRASVNTTRPGGNFGAMFIHRDSGGADITSLFPAPNTSDSDPWSKPVEITMLAGSTSSVDYHVRYGSSTGTVYLNQTSGSVNRFGASCLSWHEVEEIVA